MPEQCDTTKQTSRIELAVNILFLFFHHFNYYTEIPYISLEKMFYLEQMHPVKELYKYTTVLASLFHPLSLEFVFFM